MDRRNRRNHHQIPFLPPRPKKPLTGYSLFLRNYFDQNQNDPADERNLTAAAEEWRQLPAAQREEFTARVAEEKARYNREMDAWKKIRKALQKPPTAYGLFIRQRWDEIKRTGGNRRGVAAVGQVAARDWGNMTALQRQIYFDAREHMMQRYNEHLTQVQTGGAIQQNWMTEAFEQTELYRLQQERLAVLEQEAAAAAADEGDVNGD